nr:complement receptor type 1 [Pelodiscus sinensis]|eukprot:XP_025034356.1 complement receptor type 1 [Pelodiscus sinensis]
MNHFIIGAIAKYTCRPGYIRHPGMSSSVTCLENGRWSEASEFCKRKSCGHPGELENGRIRLNDNMFGSVVNFTCDEGHRMIGKSSRRCVLFGVRVAWSGELPFCERIPCLPPPDIPNGTHNGVLMDEFYYGTAITYKCDKDYPPTGETSIYCTTKDGLNGVWSARPPRCGEVRCPVPHIPNGRKVSADKSIYSYKDNVTFECNPGYKMKGPRVSQCQTDQTWDPPVPVCEQVEQCRSPPRIRNGRLSSQVSDVFTSGMSVKYQCNPGYFLVGEASLHCTASGAWSNPFPQCEARCVNPELENGRTNGALAPYRPGAVAMFKCEPGYILRGSAETRCQRDGSWDPPVPICEREVLCMAPKIQHGRQVAGHGPVYRPRDRVSFECDPGYTLDGSRQIECKGNATWDPPVPVCIQPLPCLPPPVIRHGKHDANPLAAFPSGTYVNYSCEPGYALRGEASIYCTTSGTWSHPSPLCEDGCGVPTRLSFAELRNEYKNQTNFVIGATAKYTCRPGYSRHPRIQPIITCLENRSWSKAPEFCKRKSCGHPGEPENGRVILTETEFGSTANFTCDEGHRLIGWPSIRCVLFGLRVAWSRDLPTCERILCNPPPNIPNGKHSGVLVDEFSYGSAVTYACDNGYPLTGEASILCTTEDGLNGVWRPRAPWCGEVRCPAPHILNGRREPADRRVYSYKDSVTFECDPGYTMKGHRVSRCQTDQTWDPPVPVCERVTCVSPELEHSITNGALAPYGPGDVAVLECEPGYTLRGSSRPRCQNDGSWDPPVPICERVTCVKPELQNGKTNGALARYGPGDVAVLECEPGYTLRGSSRLWCQNDGSWDPPVPICERVTCMSPELENGRTNGALAPYSPGDVAVLECEPGYTLRGSSRPRCQSDGSWDPPVPICEKVLHCPSPPLITNGKPDSQALAVFSSGVSVNYSCEPGYSLTGHASIHCTAAGTWSPAAPRCEEVLCVAPEIQHGQLVDGRGPVYKPRDRVSFKCDPGFTLDGSRQIECGDDATWDPPVPVCIQPVGCGVPTRLSFAELRSEYRNQSYFPVGETANYTCRPGYTRYPGIRPTITCLPNGTWSEPLEFCNRKSCGHPGELENGRMNVTDILFGSMVNFSCEEGHRLIGESSRRCVISGMRVAWSGEMPFCERIPCKPPPHIPNGKHNGDLMDEFYYGSAVTYTCDNGYPTTGEASLLCTTEDGLNGVWRQPAPRCGEVRCPAPQIENGRREPGERRVYSYKDSVTFECDPGYTMKGHRVSRCQTDQTWDPPVPVCERVTCVNPELEHGRTNGALAPYGPGDVAVLECEPGYTLRGSSRPRCQSDGSWDPPVPICEKVLHCPSPPLITNGKPDSQALAVFSSGVSVNYSCEPGYSLTGHASIHCVFLFLQVGCGVPTRLSFAELRSEYRNQSYFPVGETANYTCRPGYTRHPGIRPTITCLPNGTWSEPLEFCNRKSCGHPGELENGRMNVTDILFGSMVNFSCEEGHRLIGESSRRCVISGMRVAWSGEMPFCERIPCKPPPHIPNGKHNGDLMDEFYYGSAVTYTCDNGYPTTGEASLLCTTEDGLNGVWRQPAPRCGVTCVSPDLENGRMNGALAPYGPGDVAVLECEPGYTLRGSSQPRCQNDGSWDPPVPVCEREVLCVAPEIEHGQLVDGRGPVYRPRDRVRFECDPGYNLDGSRQIECGDDATWDPPVPVCIQPGVFLFLQVGCGVPTRLSFAELRSEYRNQSYFPVGETANYTCRPGYSRHPGIRPTITCLPNGSWSEPLEFCRRKSCGHPGELENGRMNVTDMLFGSIVNFSCEEGHRLIGDSYRQCVISGIRVAWSGDMPFCERIPCYPPPEILHGKHNGDLMDEFSYGSTVTYTCDNGYPPTGEASLLCTTEDGLNGVWRPRAPHCGEVRCPAPQIENGRREPGERRVYSYKDSVTFECDPGYTMKGHRVSRCQTDQTWDPPVPVCERVSEVLCTAPEIQHGRQVAGRQSVYRPRDRVRFECDPGYTLDGSRQIECGDDTTWHPPVPVCIQSLPCPPPAAIRHGKHDANSLAAFLSGTYVNYSCEPGYTLRGEASIYCTTSGTWSHPSPLCEGCPSPPSIISGKSNVQSMEDFAHGSSLTLSCDVGYILIGAATMYCMPSGTWDPPPPRCEVQSSYNFISIEVILGITVGCLLLLVVMIIIIIRRFVTKQNAGYYDPHENHIYQNPGTHIIEQKTSFAA